MSAYDEQLANIVKYTKLIGLTVEEAEATVGQNIRIRVTKVDGEYIVGTDDYDPERLNVGVVDDHIAAIFGMA